MTPSFRRVQRVPTDWPVVHLEDSPPTWDGLEVAGLVAHPQRLDLDGLRALGTVDTELAVHCVWGWSRPDEPWAGVPFGRLLDLVGAHGSHVVVGSASGTYSSCLPIADAVEGLLAFDRGGRELPMDEGGPVRYLAPPRYWAYKGVKWVASIEVVDGFRAGFWESRVADPVGLIPPEVER